MCSTKRVCQLRNSQRVKGTAIKVLKTGVGDLCAKVLETFARQRLQPMPGSGPEWLKPRPESSLDCLIYAEFSRHLFPSGLVSMTTRGRARNEKIYEALKAMHRTGAAANRGPACQRRFNARGAHFPQAARRWCFLAHFVKHDCASRDVFSISRRGFDGRCGKYNTVNANFWPWLEAICFGCTRLRPETEDKRVFRYRAN